MCFRIDHINCVLCMCVCCTRVWEEEERFSTFIIIISSLFLWTSPALAWQISYDVCDSIICTEYEQGTSPKAVLALSCQCRCCVCRPVFAEWTEGHVGRMSAPCLASVSSRTEHDYYVGALPGRLGVVIVIVVYHNPRMRMCVWRIDTRTFLFKFIPDTFYNYGWLWRDYIYFKMITDYIIIIVSHTGRGKLQSLKILIWL